MIERENELAERILQLIPLNNLDSRLQDQALQAGDLFEYKKKQVVFEAGSRDAYTYYLVEGDIALESADASPLLVSAGSEQAQRALAQLQPRRYTARTTSKAIMYRIERAVLDQLLTEEQVLAEQASIVEVNELDDDDDDGDWMTQLLSSELFTRLPHDNIQRFFSELEPLPAAPGDIIVEQGSQGEYLYIVAEGKCAVSRIAPRSNQELQLAILKEGDVFGEESLISNSPCNASVKMTSAGFLMRLAKRSFEELVSKATLKPLTWTEACKEVEEGAKWLDVRFNDEHDLNAIAQSLNIPLNTLRLEAKQLDRALRYIVYCDTGARSSTGAFLLARLGFDTYYLAGGLDRTPLGQEAGVATDIRQARPVPKDTPSADLPQTASGDEETSKSDTFEFEMVSGDQASATPVDTVPQPESEPTQPVSVAKQTPQSAAPTAADPSDAPALAALEGQLENLRAERDKAATYARKGAQTVKELKGRYEELRQAALAERNRRETLEREISDAQAAAQRQLEMEKSRLNSELELVRKKLVDSTQANSSLEQQLRSGRETLQQAQKQSQQLEESKISIEVASEDALATLREQFQVEQSRANQAEAALQSLRTEVEDQLTSTRETLRSKEAQTSQLEQAVATAESHLDEQKLQLETQRAEFDAELKSAQSNRDEIESRLRNEKTRLEAAAAVQEQRSAGLDQREIDLQDTSSNWETEVAQREATLHQQELELSEARASWQTQIDAAIASERERLEIKFQEQTQGLMDAQAAETLAEQRCAELRGEYDALAMASKVEFESRLEAAQSGAMPQLNELKARHEAQIAEREALHEDEHRQLEAENLHLRDALVEAQKLLKNQTSDTALPTTPTGPDLTIELEPETPIVTPVQPPEPAPLPVIEILDTPMKAAETAKERIVSTDQLAEIRKKMQEKLDAHRK